MRLRRKLQRIGACLSQSSTRVNDFHINRNFFELLGLPPGCNVDITLLEQHYRQLQAELHPDRFVNAGADQRLAALQQSSLLNDAYTTLKSPLLRAEHLLALHGIDAREHVQSHMDSAFLLNQMQLRETLEGLQQKQDLTGLANLQTQAKNDVSAVWQGFVSTMEAAQFDKAKRLFHKLQFLYKLIDEIAEAEDRVLD